MCWRVSYSRMRGEGFSFYFAGLGVEPRLLKTALPSATVRNHLQLSGLQTTFGGLKRCAMPFVAHVALRGILTNLIKCSVWQAQYFWEVFGRWLAFFVAGAALGTCPCAICTWWIDGSLAQDIDFEAENFVVHERAFCSCETWKFEGVSYEMLVVSFLQCLVSVLWFCCCVAVPMGKAAKPFMFEAFKRSYNVFLRGRRGRRGIPSHSSTCFVTCQKSFCVTRTIVSRDLQKMTCIFRRRCGTLDVPMWHVHVAWQAQRFGHVHCKAVSSGDNLQIAWDTVWGPVFVAGAACGEVLTLWRLDLPRSIFQTFHTLHCTLDAPYLHCTLYTSLLFKLHALRSTFCTPRSPPHTLLSTLHSTSHSTPCTLHVTLPTLHSTRYTSHSTLYTSHSTLHILHSKLHTSHSILYTPCSTCHTPRSSLHTLHSTFSTLHFTLHTPQSPLYIRHSQLHMSHFTVTLIYFTLRTLHSPLPTPHSAIYSAHITLHTWHPPSPSHTLHFTLHTLHFRSTLPTPHSTLLRALHVTLHTPHSTLCPRHSTLRFTPRTSQSPLHTLHPTPYTPHVTLHASRCILYTPHSIPPNSYNFNCALYTAHLALHTPPTPSSTILTLHSALHTLHSTFDTPHLPPSHSTLYTPHLILYTLHSPLPTPHYTPHPTPRA